MKFAILSKGDSKSDALKQKMMSYMKDFEMIEDTEAPDIVISVGGDGTLLQAFHTYSHRLDDCSFVGIHTGHLGFYADWLPHEVENWSLRLRMNRCCELNIRSSKRLCVMNKAVRPVSWL